MFWVLAYLSKVWVGLDTDHCLFLQHLLRLHEHINNVHQDLAKKKEKKKNYILSRIVKA